MMHKILEFPVPSRIFSVEEYFNFHEELVNQDSTNGEDTNPLAKYSLLNWKRLNRVYNQFRPEALNIQPQTHSCNQIWYLITEPWCGDAAQTIPVVFRLAELHPGVQLRVILRDENPSWMDRFLTNNAKSIPILAIFNQDSGELKSHWGPRPAALQEIFLSLKENNTPKEIIQETLQKWYNHDKGRNSAFEIAKKSGCFDLTQEVVEHM